MPPHRDGDAPTGPTSVQTNSPAADPMVQREDRVLAGAAILGIVIATTLVPWGGSGMRSMQALLLGVPAAFAATVAWTRGERRIFAPPAALVVAIGLSGVLALARGATWMFSIGAAAFILGGWLPWPRWRTPAASTVVLWALALAPLALLAAAAIVGWSSWPAQLIEGRRIKVAPLAGNLPSWSLLWSVFACGVLATRGARGARALQAASLLLLGATGTRAAGVVAVGAFAVMIWHDRGLGMPNLLRRHGAWVLFALTWLPRAVPRSLGEGGDRIAGVRLAGRSQVWETYWEHGRDMVLTGGGIGRPQQIAQRPELHGYSTHNEFFWLALSVGLLGTILVVAAWVVAFRARTPWVRPAHPELLAPAVLLPVIGLVDDHLLALTFIQPYLILLAAAGAGNRWRAGTSAQLPTLPGRGPSSSSNGVWSASGSCIP